MQIPPSLQDRLQEETIPRFYFPAGAKLLDSDQQLIMNKVDAAFSASPSRNALAVEGFARMLREVRFLELQPCQWDPRCI